LELHVSLLYLQLWHCLVPIHASMLASSSSSRYVRFLRCGLIVFVFVLCLVVRAGWRGVVNSQAKHSFWMFEACDVTDYFCNFK
jgi:hypothetical protein